MKINTSNIQTIRPYLQKLYIPSKNSHKGQNGKVLVIGGSTLFHSSPIWAAEIASHFADMVHFSSTQENNEIISSLKKSFRDGMIIHRKDIPAYVAEDDAMLIGPGMVRAEKLGVRSYELEGEARYTYDITKRLLHDFPAKKFVLDAGALQIMDSSWLKSLQTPAILTPHQLEFQRLFGIDLHSCSLDEKAAAVKEKAAEFRCIILLKAVTDIVSDGVDVVQIEGGNAGLTKGGTGDVLAGLVVSLYAKNDPITSAVIASFLEKRAAEVLAKKKAIGTILRNFLRSFQKF